MLESSPGESCDDIYQINKITRGTSGYYWINTASGTHQVYCDMKLQCGSYKGGWTGLLNLIQAKEIPAHLDGT